MLHGLMVVNAFLRTTKFDDIYHTLLSAAHGEGMELDVRTNAELCCETATGAFASGAFDFVLFWDKDVQLAWQLEQLGMRVFNGASAILACVTRRLTWLRLRRAGIPMPRTILAPKTFANVGYPAGALCRRSGARAGVSRGAEGMLRLLRPAGVSVSRRGRAVPEGAVACGNAAFVPGADS